MYTASLLSIWYVPVGPVKSFQGYRMKYERNYPISEIGTKLLREKLDTPLYIDVFKIEVRLLSIWIATGLALLLCHIAEKKIKQNKNANKTDVSNPSSPDR